MKHLRIYVFSAFLVAVGISTAAFSQNVDHGKALNDDVPEYDFRRPQAALDHGGAIAVCECQDMSVFAKNESLGVLISETGNAQFKVLKPITGTIPPTLQLRYSIEHRDGDSVWKEPMVVKDALVICLLMKDADDRFNTDDRLFNDRKYSASQPSQPYAVGWHATRVVLLKSESDPIIDSYVEIARLFSSRGRPGEHTELLDAANVDPRPEVRQYLGDLIVGHLASEDFFFATDLEDVLIRGPVTRPTK